MRGPTLGAAAREALDAAALRGERLIAVARFLFCAAILIRSVAIWDARGWEDDSARALVTLPALVLAMAFSVYELRRRPRSSQAIERLLSISVAFDALVAFIALLPNPLWPWPGYLGLVNMPDLTALVVITFATGFRMSPRAALLGAVLNAVSYGVLVAVDRTVSGAEVPILPHHYMLYGMFVLAAGGLAVALAVRTRQVVKNAADAASRAERAQANLSEILSDHHDLRSLVTAMNVEAELLGRALEEGATADRVREMTERLRADVASCVGSLQQIRGRALGELLALEQVSAVEVAPVVSEVVAVVERRFSRVAIASQIDPAAVAAVAGGVSSLRRMLFNLVVNACEGDGTSAAGTVRIEVDRAPPDKVAIRIVDDGPGLAPAILEHDQLGGSSKAQGTGLGLPIASAIARASGGALRLANGADRGAVVIVELRRDAGLPRPDAGSVRTTSQR